MPVLPSGALQLVQASFAGTDDLVPAPALPYNPGIRITSFCGCAVCLLTMDLTLDVDTSGEDLSSSLFPLSNSFFENHIRDVLPQGQLTTLNDDMTAMASLLWLVAAEGDDLQLRSLIKNVFALLRGALKDTDIKDNLVTSQTAREMVESFNEDELQRLKIVVQNCVEKKDWVHLIRTCVSDYRTVGLRSIVTTAALTIPTRPNAASTPLHLSRLNRGAHSK